MGQTFKSQAEAKRRKKMVLGHLKQEHIGDYFMVDIGDSASWRRDDQME